jgi:spore germination cell wall hydrolase CwlJ-like protein
MISVNRIQIIALTALLAGCASAPQPNSEPDVSYRISKQHAESAHKADTQAQQRASKVEFQAEPREVDARTQRCLAQVIYWEARGEGQQGMVAVASVVLNRVEDNRFPDTVCGVVYQGGESPPCQFSWWCDGKTDYPTNQTKWAETNSLANTILTARPLDPTDGALFYHNTSIQDPWHRPLTARIGSHIFYR